MSENNVMSPAPDADEIQCRHILKSHAQSHDLLDTYGVPRSLGERPVAMLSLPMRIEWFMQRGLSMFTKQERASIHVGFLPIGEPDRNEDET